MAKYSNNKDFNVYIRNLIKSSDQWLFCPNGASKHPYLLFTPSNQKIPIPVSPKGDPAGFKNFKADIRRILRQYEQTHHSDNDSTPNT